MNTNLLQVKIDDLLKGDLQEIAEHKGIPISSLVKMLLKEMVRKEKKFMFTENGLTQDQELEILAREAESVEAYKTGKIKPVSGRQFLRELNA